MEAQKDRHLEAPGEANRDKHINFLAEENGDVDPADEQFDDETDNIINEDDTIDQDDDLNQDEETETDNGFFTDDDGEIEKKENEKSNSSKD